MDRKKELLRSAALLLLSLICGAALSLAPETAAQGVERLIDENSESAALLRPLWEEWRHEKT